MATSDSPTPEYRDVHGLRLFRCGPYAVTLSTKACAARHLEARQATGRDAEKLVHCRSCPIGAKHAGQELVHFSRHYDKPICPRCHKTWLRLIGNSRCVSCYNREREFDSQRNAKGRVPAGVRPIADVAFSFNRDGEVVRFEGRIAVGVWDRLTDEERAKRKAANPKDNETLKLVNTGRAEAVLQCLRTKRGALTFGFSGDFSLIRQGQLL